MAGETFWALSDAEQDLQRARWADKQGRCARCGLPIDQCSDPHQVFYPQRTICFPTMEAVAAERRYAALHETEPFHDGTFTSWAEEADAGHPYRYDDGVTIWASPADLSPTDNFLQRPQGGDDDDQA